MLAPLPSPTSPHPLLLELLGAIFISYQIAIHLLLLQHKPYSSKLGTQTMLAREVLNGHILLFSPYGFPEVGVDTCNTQLTADPIVFTSAIQCYYFWVYINIFNEQSIIFIHYKLVPYSYNK